MNEKVIVLDCDGVLLDYNQTYAALLEDFTGQKITINSPRAYYSHNYCDIQLEPTKKSEFYQLFNQKGWNLMQALPYAIEATHKLKKAGYKIIVVTSIPKEVEAIRHNHLLKLGFSVDITIATGEKTSSSNPKQQYIEKIQPAYFVDDLWENFSDISCDTKFVLIDYEEYDSPNLNISKNIKVHSKHTSLINFVNQHII